MSFFGKKTTRAEADTRKSVVMGTGGKIDDIVSALIEAANDSNKDVKLRISDSLKDIGRQQPELVLSSCIQFIRAQGKNKRDHTILLLHLIIQLLEYDLYNISEQLAIHLIQMALGEMTKEKNVVPEWQGPAAVILVTLGRRFPQPVWTVLVELFPPGSIPHYFVIKTMGDLSTANPTAIVPNLKEVMARALPILGQIKKDNIRWVFASAFGRWCDAVLTYLADVDNPDKSITQETFSSEVYPAYEVIFNNWIGSKESKVRLACVHSVGQMCAVMPREQFDSQLARIIPVVLKLYGKEKKHLQITQGLGTILQVACHPDSQPMMEPLLNIVLGVIHPLLCSTIASNSDDIDVIKTTNELLRCFEIMAAGFPELLCSYLLGKLDVTKVKSPTVRAGTLNIVRHLVTRLDDQLLDKKELILAGVRPLVDNETSLEVRKVLCQVVIAMASQGYLQLEGGQRAIEFVIKQSAIPQSEIDTFNAAAAKKKVKPDTTPEKLRNMCDNVLHLATTTVPAMSDVLWPYLFEFIIPPQHTEALHIVCKCLAHIARTKRDANAPDYLLDFDKEVNLPNPPELIVRLLVMLNEPQRRGNLGIMILSCLQAIGPVLNPIVCGMWDNAMPKLAMYIENNAGTESWDSSTWEDLTLRLLSETIKIMNDEEWTQNLGEQLSNQLEFYEKQPNVKKCAMKHMGLILQKLNRKEFIKAKLDMIFNGTNHADEFERQGCAQAFGFCSASHLDIVLDKIKTLSGPAPVKKSGGFFGMFSGGGGGKGGPQGPAKQTLFLCLGYVASYASPKLVLARLDSHLLHTLEPYLVAKAMKAATKEVLIQSIDLVAKALHPSHLQEEYQFRRRDEFIELLITYMAPGKEVTPKARTLGLNTCSTLIHLDPAMGPELEEKLVQSTMKFYYERPPVKEGKNVSAAAVEADIKSVEELSETFNEMLGAILYMDCSTVCLGRIFDLIIDYLHSEHEYQRTRVISSMQALLKKFIEFKSSGEAEDTGMEDCYAAIGKTLGLLVPRCADPEPSVRMAALESIELLFFIDHMLSSSVGQDSYNFTPPEPLTRAHELRARMEEADIHEQFLIMHQISTIAAQLLSGAELTPFLVHAIKGLNDPFPSSSSGTCVMLNGMIKVRGEELPEEVSNLVGGMLKAMENVTDEKTMNGTLHSLRTLASHHLLQVLEQLLLSPTPHSQNIVKSIQVIVKDPNLVVQVIDHLTDIMNNSQILEENTNGSKPVCTHAPRAMSATAALAEIFELDEMEDVINENFSQVFCSLLLRFGTTRYGKSDEAAQQALTAFKNFIQCAKLEALQEKLDKKERWAKLDTNDDFHYTITDIINSVCKTHPEEMNAIYEFILPYLQGNFTGQRIVTAAVFAEMIRHIKDDQALLQQIINNLLTIMVDQSLKLMTIRGLGNIADAGKEEVNRFSSTVIDALMCSIDAEDEVIAMEAMRGLAKVFELVDESCVAPILVNICHRIRPAFEKDHEDIRSASFNLFGTLHRFGNAEGATIFYEQIHNNLPALFIHVNDESEHVRKACKKALKNFGPLLKAQPLTDFFHEVLDEDRELNYSEFLNRLSSLLIEHFPERLNFYVMTSIEFYKSHWTCLRVAAATFTGFALGNVPPEKKHAVGLNPSIITAAVIGLLKQKSPEVRSEAAMAMSYLHHY